MQVLLNIMFTLRMPKYNATFEKWIMKPCQKAIQKFTEHISTIKAFRDKIVASNLPPTSMTFAKDLEEFYNLIRQLHAECKPIAQATRTCLDRERTVRFEYDVMVEVIFLSCAQ
jgi:hypothetical protein